jgi:hypothetical protein
MPHEIYWTEFRDAAASSKQERCQDWAELVEHLKRAPTFPSKQACPWLKLARFGSSRSHGGSLRNNNNVAEVFGVEGDYDGGAMSVSQAVQMLERAHVKAVVYTSPSHHPDRPRWRVLAPLSRPLPAQERTRMLARINGVLARALSSESFTLSQSYYYGRVEGQPEYLVRATFDDPEDGHYVDQLDELDAIAHVSTALPPGQEQLPPSHAIASAVEHLGRRLRTGDNRRELLRRYVSDKSRRGLDTEEIMSLVEMLAERYFDPADPLDRRNIRQLADDFTRADYRSGASAGVGVGGRESEETADAGPSALPLVFAEDLQADQVGVQQIVEDTLTAGGLSVMYGESNSGKSFLACDMDCSLASGIPWLGKRTVKGAVMYVAGEGSESIKMRVLAWKRHHGLDPALAVVPVAVNLLDPMADVGKVIEAAANVAAHYGMPVTKITVDTLARAFGGGNENASEDMGAVIANCDRIRAVTKAHVMAVHHQGKDASKGSRGHSSLKAATDTEIEVTAEESTKLHTARITKQRDLGSRGDEVTAKFTVVEMGFDQWGKAVTTCIVESTTLKPAAKSTRKKGAELREAIKDILLEQASRTMKRADLVKRMQAAGFTTSPIYRAIADMVESKEVSEMLNMIYLERGRS